MEPDDMMIHQNHQELYDAFIIKWNRWIEKSVIKPINFDPHTIDQSLNGDLMHIWDVKYHSNGTFDK